MAGKVMTIRKTSPRENQAYIVSVNGTNFVAGEKESSPKVQKLDKEKMVNTTKSQLIIEWMNLTLLLNIWELT